MKLDLTGRTALVTGSTTGIGFAIASGLAEEGATVWINGRTQARVDQAIAALRSTRPDARLRGAVADVGAAEGAAALAAQVGDVDVLVNNVGFGRPKPFDEALDADWTDMFETNVMSGVRLSRHFLPGMRARDWGRIVFISSESGVQIPAENIHYGVSKAAQIAVGRGLAESLRGSGVTVNSVLPGATRSGGLQRTMAALEAEGRSVAEFTAEFFATRRPTSLQRRFAEPEEVANLVVFLCSPAGSGTHGAALRVDGGTIKSML